MMNHELTGFLNLDKPSQWTSHDCVAKVRRLLKMKRVGHGGTLDPMATGVLPIAVGTATRLLPYLPENKSYRARIRLGVTTTTDDLEGEVTRLCPCPALNREQIESYLPRFIGTIEQIPPMYSAIQKNGRRLYELARKGEIIEVPPRQVKIDKITVLDWFAGEFPELEVTIDCGSGTYIRSIARDLGNCLGTGGTLARLTRTASCGLSLSESLSLDTLATAEMRSILIPPNKALKHLEFQRLSAENVVNWFHGRKISLPLSQNELSSSKIAIESEEGQFLGIGEILGEGEERYLQPKVVLSDEKSGVS